MPPPLSTDLGKRISIAKSALQRSTELRNFFRIEPNAAGTDYEFVFTATGARIPNVEKAVDYITSLQITDYRTFNNLGLGEGERRGAKHIAEEARILNESLKTSGRSGMTLQTQEVLRRMGLDQYIDQDMTVEYAKFNFGGGEDELRMFMDSPFGKNYGMLNITDDGITVIRYRDAAGQLLDSVKTNQLQYALGLGALSPSFIQDLMTKDPSGVGKAAAKLPKRYQSLYTARGLSIAGEDLQESILEFRAAKIAKKEGVDMPTARSLAVARGLPTSLNESFYHYDDIGSFFKGLYSMDTLKREDRYLLTMGMGLTNKEMTQFSGMKLTSMGMSKPIPQKIKNNLKEMVKQYAQIDDPQELQDFIDMLGNDYVTAGGDAKELKKILKARFEADNKDIYANKALTIFDGVERARDGEIMTNIKYLELRVGTLNERLSNLKATIGLPIGIKEQSLIDDIESEIEALKYQIKHKKSQTFRGTVGVQSSKAESTAVDFSRMPGKLRDSIAIVYDSSLKPEVAQGRVESILMDMSMSAPKPVRVDPLMLMYHSDYLNTDEFQKSMTGVVRRQIDKAQEFMRTGIVPEEILDAVKREADTPVEMYTRTT
jgi:hypothetical protein